MNIDERIEALTQTVELLARMHMDSEKREEERKKEWDGRFVKMLDIVDHLDEIIRIQ